MGLMRITKGLKGLAQYLKEGHKKESEFNRNEKDYVQPLFGDLDLFEKSENYLNENKKYASNYTHVTFAFSKNDEDKLDNMSTDARLELLQNLTRDILKYLTSGYDLEREVIAYAEEHRPKIKKEKDRITGEIKDRLGHIHLGISHQNTLSAAQIRIAFHKASVDSVFQAYLNKKYDLDLPRKEGQRENPERDYLREELKNIKTYDEFTNYMNRKGFELSEETQKKKTFFSVKVDNGTGRKRVNLIGGGFEHLAFLAENKDKEVPQEVWNKKLENETRAYPEAMEMKKLKKELVKFYRKRKKEIIKRRSKKDTKFLEELQEKDKPEPQKTADEILKETYKKIDEENREKNQELKPKIKGVKSESDTAEIQYQPYQSYHEKTFYDYYRVKIELSVKLEGYFINIEQNNPIFSHAKKGITVIDTGTKIIGKLKNSSQEALMELANLMIDVALAKGWKLSKLTFNGSKKYQEMSKKIVQQRLREKYLEISNQIDKTLNMSIVKQRPMTPIQAEYNELKSKRKMDQSKQPTIKQLKEELSADVVLRYAVRKFKIKRKEYETVENKINNKSNFQKPKNVIDFLIREVNLSTREAFDLAKKLHQDPANRVMESKETTAKNNEGLKNEYANHQSIFSRTNRREREPRRDKRDDMRTMSDSDMVLSSRARESKGRSILPSNERDNGRKRARPDSELHTAESRNHQNEEEGRTVDRIEQPSHGFSIHKKYDDDTYVLDYPKIKRVVDEILKIAKNDKEFNEQLTVIFNLKSAKFQTFDANIVFLTKENKKEEVKLSDIGTTKDEIIDKMRENRECVEDGTQGQKPKNKNRPKKG